MQPSHRDRSPSATATDPYLGGSMPAPRRRLRALLSIAVARWLQTTTRGRAVIVAGVLVAAVICLSIGLGLIHGASGAPTRNPLATSSWQTYRDPAGLFTVRLPPGWIAHLTAGTASISNSGGSATEKTELVVFSMASDGATGRRLTVYAEPIQTAFEREWYCQGRAVQNATFHHIPAEHEGASWIFNVANAHFQVLYAAPNASQRVAAGQSTPALAGSSPTIASSTSSSGDQAIIDAMLGSFQPENVVPLAC